MKFKGDIIITDPCYFIKNEDWKRSWYGELVDVLGIKNYLTSDTGYGDWSCTTFDSNNEAIGEFCADAGLVGVFYLDEVLKYNPDFDYHIERPWTTTLIKDFDGEVDIVREFDEDDEVVVSVVGNGNINFRTRQTGF